MSGFVDVTGWSKEDVRRLGHADDEETNQRSSRFYKSYRKTSQFKKPTFSYSADNVWGAAVVAYRCNKGYVKALAPGIEAHKTNRQLMEELLSEEIVLFKEDIEEGRKIRQYFQGLTFKVIEGKTLTPFFQSAMEIASKDKITDNLGVGTIASLPATYKKMTERDSVDNKIKWARGGFIGSVGDKTTQTIEIVKKLWSNNWNTWYYTGLNKEDQVLFFAYKKDIEIGTSVTIEGKVKSHRDNSTQLSHVKVIENV
jgi:hypothetical protein